MYCALQSSCHPRIIRVSSFDDDNEVARRLYHLVPHGRELLRAEKCKRAHCIGIMIPIMCVVVEAVFSNQVLEPNIRHSIISVEVYKVLDQQFFKLASSLSC